MEPESNPEPMRSDAPTKYPVEILCEEIGFQYGPHLERADIFIGFVSALIDEVADMVGWRAVISRGFSEPGYETMVAHKPLKSVREMLALDPVRVAERDHMCAALHRQLDQPDDGPCNHLLDMLSSCVSAVRFGLEVPCHSRHAAEAANHVWKHKYGVRLLDECTSDWQKDWARRKLTQAIQVGTTSVETTDSEDTHTEGA